MHQYDRHTDWCASWYSPLAAAAAVVVEEVSIGSDSCRTRGDGRTKA
jgi:hypothetical protein